ncbi:MAG: alpha/beta fold hydrolase [Candidatus Rokuibacteriota bacterium]
MPKVRVGDIQLNYTLQGSGEPVVLIGGLASGTWQGWAGHIPVLAKEYRVIAFDNRGIGESDAPDVPYTTTMMARDTLGLMDALGLDRAHVIGKSLGGAIGQMMALERPERVRCLVMTSSFMRLDPRGVRLLESWRDTVQQFGWERFARSLMVHFVTEEFFEQHPDAVARAERAIVDTRRTLRGYLNTSAAAETHDSRERIRDIRVPVLVMCGSEDMVTPARQSEAMARLIPGAECHIIPRSLHGFLAERPDTFQIILDFLRRH